MCGTNWTRANSKKKRSHSVGVRFFLFLSLSLPLSLSPAFAFIIFQINWMNKAKLGHCTRIMAMAAICFRWVWEYDLFVVVASFHSLAHSLARICVAKNRCFSIVLIKITYLRKHSDASICLSLGNAQNIKHKTYSDVYMLCMCIESYERTVDKKRSKATEKITLFKSMLMACRSAG